MTRRRRRGGAYRVKGFPRLVKLLPELLHEITKMITFPLGISLSWEEEEGGGGPVAENSSSSSLLLPLKRPFYEIISEEEELDMISKMIPRMIS